MKLMAATLFVEIWKRRQSILAWEWDLEMDDQEEQPRPEFEVSSDKTIIFLLSAAIGAHELIVAISVCLSPFSALS